MCALMQARLISVARSAGRNGLFKYTTDGNFFAIRGSAVDRTHGIPSSSIFLLNRAVGQSPFQYRKVKLTTKGEGALYGACVTCYASSKFEQHFFKSEGDQRFVLDYKDPHRRYLARLCYGGVHQFQLKQNNAEVHSLRNCRFSHRFPQRQSIAVAVAHCVS